MWEFCWKVLKAMGEVFTMEVNTYYQEGFNAYHNYERLEDNPYPDTLAGADWETGWVDASNRDEM